MEITLPAHLEQFIAEQVQSGSFASPHEALCKAVENLQSLERRRAELKREIELGMEQLERGESITVPLEKLPEFFDEILHETFQQLDQEKAAS